MTARGIKYSCMTRYYNIRKAKERLRYKPIFGMREGLQRAVDFELKKRGVVALGEKQ
jgi:sterol-4alpha-carboxylate 3-dehydrogenase (decarboxylating)